MRNHFCRLFVCLKKAFNLGHPGTITMKQAIAICAAIGLILACPLFADFGVVNRGIWPDDWPKELETLRERSRTLEGPKQSFLNYAISFTTRDEFEAAGRTCLRSKRRALLLFCGGVPAFGLKMKRMLGFASIRHPKVKSRSPTGRNAKGNWETTNYIELIVDGEIVDLNRILLPPDTPIIDERFQSRHNQAVNRSRRSRGFLRSHFFGGGPVTAVVRRCRSCEPLIAIPTRRRS